ncbi:MAG: UDP-N-acetylmuramate:L-alanyl-gamma-D-glutamyl-meso-diaminopimelate ligase, partial [Gammaproteobacteria bacterium]|nr:UDP-N-acetylmuramate:L-alanyl-gamma-D-glutamyl-meso-diaminopimelate ligase [Gammaproteobacteria bacterium]
TQLTRAGIDLIEGWDPAQLEPAPDLVVIGNALSRGNPLVEAVLDRGIPYTSGPQWLAEHLLGDRWVLAVSGTHGKTTTSSMLAWILDQAGLNPGFLIGGVPTDFGCSARLGSAPFFVIEADEYDTAFFDKRSKFVHYRPRTLILNNLEFDHADIFPDLAAIERQFNHLIRTVPGSGLIISNAGESNLKQVLNEGCWTPVERFGETGGWSGSPLTDDSGTFEVKLVGETIGRVSWGLAGRHNMLNGLAALAAARHAGVPPTIGIQALSSFSGVKRRLEHRGTFNGVTVYDDFAHHPTAIHETLQALRGRVGQQRILVALELRSNTMRMGIHQTALAESLQGADSLFLSAGEEVDWPVQAVIDGFPGAARLLNCGEATAEALARAARPGDQILVMSNGGFGGIFDHLEQKLGASGSSDPETRRSP